jgi:hypothetical protein
MAWNPLLAPLFATNHWHKNEEHSLSYLIATDAQDTTATD